MNPKFIRLIIVFAAVIIAAVVLYNVLAPEFEADAQASQSAWEYQPTADAAQSLQAPASKTPAPDFMVYDDAGNPVKLSDFKGAPVVINFWATWCPYCTVEMPEFETAYKASGDTVQFMMIDATDGQQETKEKAAAYVKEKGFTFPVFYDTDLSAINTYGIQAFPTTVFVDKDGNIAAATQGRIDQKALDRGLALIAPNLPK